MDAAGGAGSAVGLDDIASVQQAIVSRAQALASGVSRRRIEWLVGSGRWRRIHVGVYATFTGPLSFEAQVWAAILRAGRGAVASHRTAAFLDGICDEPGSLIHLTVPADRHVRSRITGVHIHYAHRLPRTRHPSRLPPRTRIEETVLDLVDTSSTAREVETWVTSACQRRRTTPERLLTALQVRKKIRWRSAVEGMLIDVDAGAESPLELRHLRRVERAHGLPEGHRQRRVAGRRVIWVDVDHDEYMLRIELDGRIGHVGEGRFRDRQRDNRATSDGSAAPTAPRPFADHQRSAPSRCGGSLMITGGFAAAPTDRSRPRVPPAGAARPPARAGG